ACWVIHNAIKKSCSQPELTICIIRQGCIPPLINMLNYVDNDIIYVALQAIWIILQLGENLSTERNGENPYALIIEECGGTERINCFQFHENNDIQSIAYQIIDRFFSDDENESIGEKIEVNVHSEGSGSQQRQQRQQRQNGEFHFHW
ncbi:10976_t:CDS:1, partial [Acaulospora morrowiae]